MISQELKIFIEQNCSGKEPSDIIMEAIGNKIDQLGADADEVLAYVEECSKGPTLEQKAEMVRQAEAESRRLAEAEAERQARLAEARAKAESDTRNVELAAERAKEAVADAEKQRASAEILKEKNLSERLRQQDKKSKKRTYIIATAIILLLGGFGVSAYLKIILGESAAEMATRTAYNSVNHVSMSDLEVNTDDVPSDDPNITVDVNGDIKKQLEKYYDVVYTLKEGFYRLKKDNLYGIADAKGKIIQKPKYSKIYSRNEKGLIKIEKDGYIGYLNLKGVEVILPKYSAIHETMDNFVKVEIDGKFGLLDAETLQEVTPCEYDYIYHKENGKYKVKVNDKIGYLNEDGSVSQYPL